MSDRESKRLPFDPAAAPKPDGFSTVAEAHSSVAISGSTIVPWPVAINPEPTLYHRKEAHPLAFQIDVVELFKTPAISAVIAAATALLAVSVTTALLAVSLTQRLNRKTAESYWLRDKRASAYADLLTALDENVNADLRAADDPSYANTDTYQAVSESLHRALSTIELYGHPALITLFTNESRALMPNWAANPIDGTPFRKSADVLTEIRAQIVAVARKEFRSGKLSVLSGSRRATPGKAASVN